MLLFIGCSSKREIDKKYFDDCKELLSKILKDNDLIFGVCKDGIMGLSYDIAKENKRNVIGLCPMEYGNYLMDVECDEEIVTEGMLDSTLRIISKCDAIIILPGGIGTMYELFTSIQCKICHEHKKPIIIYNSCGFYNKLLSFIDDMYREKFVSEDVKEMYMVANSSDEVVKYIEELSNTN